MLRRGEKRLALPPSPYPSLEQCCGVQHVQVQYAHGCYAATFWMRPLTSAAWGRIFARTRVNEAHIGKVVFVLPSWSFHPQNYSVGFVSVWYWCGLHYILSNGFYFLACLARETPGLLDVKIGTLLSYLTELDTWYKSGSSTNFIGSSSRCSG
jgi:hypothetical protein